MGKFLIINVPSDRACRGTCRHAGHAVLYGIAAIEGNINGDGGRKCFQKYAINIMINV